MAKIVFVSYKTKCCNCSKSKKHTDEACPKRPIMMTSIKIKAVSRCADYLAIK